MFAQADAVPGTALPEVLDETRRLWHPLNYLRESLADAETRQRWSDANPNGVEYAGEVGSSYVEAVFRAGERLYSIINCLCRHGVLFPYLSRMHPASTQLEEPFPVLPKIEEIEFTGWTANDGSGHQCDSPAKLQTAICREVKTLTTIDPDHSLVFLHKEIARVGSSNTLECTGDGLSEQPPFNLKPSQRKTYSQYKAAIEREPRLAEATDKEVYEYVEANLLDDGEPLAKFGSWSRNLREARRCYGEQKNRPRSGRTGRSVVRASEL